MRGSLHCYLLVAVIAPAAMVVEPTLLRAQAWEFHSVDAEGESPSIVIGPDQLPRLAYFIRASGSMMVMHAIWEAGAGRFESEIAASGPFRLQAAIAVDSLSRPHITFHDHHLGNPVHTWKDGPVWVQENVFSPNHDGWSSSVAIGSDNLPRFSFNDGGDIGGTQGGDGIEYAWFDGAGWNTEPIGSDTGIYWFCGSSLALGRDDSAYIAYFSDNGNNLMLAKGTQGGVWEISAVDTAGDVGLFPSVQLDANERPHIAYFQELSPTSGIVKLASFDGSDWAVVTIDTLDNVDLTEDVENMISLAIDNSGRLHCSYADQSSLRYAVYDGNEAAIEDLLADPEQRLLQRTSLSLGPDGEPHLAYALGGDEGGVYYAVNRSANRFSPILSDIPDHIAIRPGGWKISLDEFVDDPDHDDEEIFWSFSGNNHLIVNYSQTRRTVSIAPPDGWKGSDTITFTATDPDSLSASDDAVFWVGPPVVSDIPDQTTGNDADFLVNLNEQVKDLDHDDSEIRWSFSGMAALTVQYDTVLQIARISAPAGWSGGETIMFEATDPDGFSGRDDATFSVQHAQVAAMLAQPVPVETSLGLNYPNPFNPTATISFRLSEPGRVTLLVYNILGQVVRRLVDEVRHAGPHEAVWDGRDDQGRRVTSGVYLYRMETKEFVETRRMLLTK